MKPQTTMLSLMTAATAAVMALAATTPVTATMAPMTRAPVFVPEALGGDCHSLKTEDACLADGCYWCKSAAVPSSCYTAEEAKRLPPAVFQCDKKSMATQVDWALVTAPADAVALGGLFTAWKATHGRSYASPMEEAMRLAVFEQNTRKIATHNQRQVVNGPSQAAFTMEVNQFADLTWAEFKDRHLAAPQHCSATHTSNTQDVIQELSTTPPQARDWREVHAVSPVKNQGNCGSCWTFSTTGCLESHVKLKHGRDVLLSEQNLLDCAQAFDNHGCNGGLPSHAFEYVHYNGGLDTEETYPYEAKVGKCKFNTYHVGVKVAGVVNITSRHEDELVAAVGNVGPVSIAFQVVSDFQFYKDGVYESSECKSGEGDVNHAVLAVGYGRDATTGKDHWIVKNSWGTEWGMKGFFQIARGRNMCGLADCASYPLVE